ncbi:MAG: flagellar hook capping protein [Verrucomicrobia bacterium]|nr:flagellar hook capping protein [Verrucomicrobiota bacterium]
MTMSTAAISAATRTAAAGVAGQPMLSQTLNQEDFLLLLAKQLSMQDPLNPVKDTEFMAQMAQFTALEQARATQAEVGLLRLEQQSLRSSALLGQEVTLQTSEDAPLIEGQVSQVVLNAGTPKIVVAGHEYDLPQVHSVRLAPLPSEP